MKEIMYAIKIGFDSAFNELVQKKLFELGLTWNSGHTDVLYGENRRYALIIGKGDTSSTKHKNVIYNCSNPATLEQKNYTIIDYTDLLKPKSEIPFLNKKCFIVEAVGYTVEIEPDGDIQFGCTTIPREKVQEIFDYWKKE